MSEQESLHRDMPLEAGASEASATENVSQESAEGSDLKARIQELEMALRDQSLRAQAEIQNIQRRTERDVANAHKYALEKFAGELLAVVDNQERAIDAIPADQEAVKALREGVVLTHKLFIDTLRKFQVEAVNPLGEPFNPELHQAVSMQPSTTAEPNSVLTVLQKGYTLNGRLIRPAIVIVATAG